MDNLKMHHNTGNYFFWKEKKKDTKVDSLCLAFTKCHWTEIVLLIYSEIMWGKMISKYV